MNRILLKLLRRIVHAPITGVAVIRVWNRDRTVRFTQSATVERARASDFYISLMLRRKTPFDMRPATLKVGKPVWAIVMQGPLKLEDNFTLQTIKSYRSWFPTAPIVLSTWIGEDQKVLDQVELLGCEVVLSDPEEFAHDQHSVNLQMMSSREGLQKAKSLGSVFALKNRTDQRLNNPHSIESLFALIDAFPLPSGVRQAGRIVLPSFNTTPFRLYSISDMFMFGHVEDLLRYWDGVYTNRTDRVAPETGYMTRFLESTGETLEWSVSHYWEVLARRFLILDTSFFNLHWPKYKNIENLLAWRGSPTTADVTFGMWLAMYEGRLIPQENLAHN